MSAATFVRSLFSFPGNPATDPGEFLKQAASAHEELFRRACDPQDPDLARLLTPLGEFLGGRATPAQKERLLCHPLFLEGLHGLAPCCPKLRHWHESVTAPPAPLPAAAADPAAPASLGHVALACRLRCECHAEGEYRLCTDVLGRMAFPFCDWSLTLYTDRRDALGRRDWLGRQLVKLRLDRGQAVWQLENSPEMPFLVLACEDCRRLIIANADPRQFRGLEFPNARLKPRLQCACPLGHGPIRYDPVGFEDCAGHAGLTGALIKQLIGAIRRNSPAVYRELRACIHTVRGFEFPESAYGVVGSFSDPTLPGVVGINVPYTPEHEPCLSPFCFTWIGHELGHTKNYLSDNILYGRGQALLRNPAERTPTVPRYGRALAVRTLFQIPYVHLYEWELLMDFWQAGFKGLPWQVPEEVVAVGEDLAAEIAEAFELIEAEAELTSLGEVALRHFRGQFARMLARWYSLRPRGKSSA
jgi:hypothetical protein